MSKFQLLIGHTSVESAHVIPDYPYGRQLRCQRRVWVETKEGHGQRFVAQTSNPKRDGLVWNKPHADRYSAITVIYKNPDNGHVEIDGLSVHSSSEQLEAFIERFGEAELRADKWIDAMLTLMRKRHAVKAA